MLFDWNIYSCLLGDTFTEYFYKLSDYYDPLKSITLLWFTGTVEKAVWIGEQHFLLASDNARCFVWSNTLSKGEKFWF